MDCLNCNTSCLDIFEPALLGGKTPAKSFPAKKGRFKTKDGDVSNSVNDALRMIESLRSVTADQDVDPVSR